MVGVLFFMLFITSIAKTKLTMKSKSTAYLLWFFFGLFGVHRFYLNKTGSGILYLLTFGVFWFGWFIDLFTLGTQVDSYNALFLAQTNSRSGSNSNINNIVVNVPTDKAGGSTGNSSDMYEKLHKLSELKEKGILTEEEFNNEKAKILSV